MPTKRRRLVAHNEFNAKWLFAVDGVEWIACRYFAVRRSAWQVPKGRVVAMLVYEPGTLNAVSPAESERMRAEMIELRRNPPRRSDLVVFERDPTCKAEMRELIRAKGGRRKSVRHRAPDGEGDAEYNPQ